MTGLPLSELQVLINDLSSPESLSPREWFERARLEADKAILAERRDKKEEMYVAYVRACLCYTNCKAHSGIIEERKKNTVWGERVKGFKEVSLVAIEAVLL